MAIFSRHTMGCFISACRDKADKVVDELVDNLAEDSVEEQTEEPAKESKPDGPHKVCETIVTENTGACITATDGTKRVNPKGVTKYTFWADRLYAKTNTQWLRQ